MDNDDGARVKYIFNIPRYLECKWENRTIWRRRR